MIESALVYDREGNIICFHLPEGRSSGYIPDTRSLWDILWENKDKVGGVAHTHPWHGEAHPSSTDTSTFSAIEKALGKRLVWAVVTFSEVGLFVWNDILNGYVQLRPDTLRVEGVEELRNHSRKGG